MFVLRSITKNQIEINTHLDVYYTLTLREKSPEEFKDITKLWAEEELENVYGLVCVNDIDLIMPLYKGLNYYIMTDDGKTFANISEK